jgi:hypothetical protein
MVVVMDRTAAPDNLGPFRRRLAEAIAWCAPRVRQGTPREVFWTPAFRPPAVPHAWSAELRAVRPPPEGLSHDLYDHPVATRPGVVDGVAQTRADALAAAGRLPANPAPDLAGGRLVLFEPDESLSGGETEEPSGGFFDHESSPGWDTWVAYVVDAERTAAWERWLETRRSGDWEDLRSFLVAWVPPPLVESVDFAILVGMGGCIRWADDVDTAFTRRLRAAGLL